MSSFVKFFALTFIPVTIILSLTWYYSNNLTLDTVRNEVARDVAAKWELIAMQDFAETFSGQTHEEIKEITAKTMLRVTLITTEGRVIDDSYYNLDKISVMDNHNFRPEVQDAKNYGSGYSTRFSDTTGLNMMYYAKRYNDDVILRVAYPISYVDQLKKDFVKQNVTVLFIVTILLGLTSAYVASRVSLPFQKLNYIAERIEQGKNNIHFPRFRDKTMIKVAGVIYRIYTTMISKQHQLEQERQKLNHIFSILDEGIILLDGENRLKHWNEKAEEYLVTKFISGTYIIKELNDYDTVRFVSSILESGATVKTQKTLKDITYEVYVRTMNDEKLIVFYDITDRAKYENFKTELVGNITHELKTPLAMIMGYSETVLNNPELPDEKKEKFLNTIYQNSGRLNNLINDMLELHKLESSGAEFIVKEPMMVSNVLEELNGIYEDAKKNIKLSSDIVSAYVMPEHFISIVTNLVDNALKYSDGDNIFVKVTNSDDKLAVFVSDEGPQIPQAERKRIFERFYTVHKSKHRSETGTGLGLSIIKHIATLYDGKVALNANDMKGNTFEVYLKEKDEDAKA